MTPAATPEHNTRPGRLSPMSSFSDGAYLRNWNPQKVRSYRQCVVQLPFGDLRSDERRDGPLTAGSVVVEPTLRLADQTFGLRHDVVGQATLFSDLEHTHERLADDDNTFQKPSTWEPFSQTRTVRPVRET